ncbi:T9SS type A sorting domain-containing protein [Pontibacter sp. G13]|uniref:T9SS type A sorting domain-containing protein n=1 Tax=Pontibacter sp. G13 TaxID=3074898 RepID=UPI00288C3EB5|nr:T9SS type A sorting domain-containing protein [Pontibacter sp. G13]WNJ18557.1 T9SS type A sorting domain-containing protein [Pontibacter sp. G13]
MKNFFTWMVATAVAGGVFAQPAARTMDPDQIHNGVVGKIERNILTEGEASSYSVASQTPSGTSLTDAVTSVKIGEASNAFTFISLENHTISAVPGVGTNGGSVAFITRQNIASCGGDNGMYRYVLSTDAGLSWDVGAGTNTPGGTAAVGCYGLGPLNPAYLQNSRYPNLLLTTTDATLNTTADLQIAYAGPVLSASGNGWDGSVVGIADNVTGTPSVTHESYPYSNGNQYFSYSMVERVPGEFWFASYEWDGTAATGNYFLNKGIYNDATGQINWTVEATITPDFDLTFDGAAKFTSVSLGFSPDGNTGFLAALGDLVGGADSVFTVWFSESVDAGNSWGTPEEVDMSQFAALTDSLTQFIGIDSANADTFVYGGGIATTAFDMDMVVDKNGNPHALAVVGNSTSYQGGGVYSTPAYSISSGLEMFLFDFTRDQYGDWNMILVGYQEYLRGVFGDPSGDGITADTWVQTSRSEDGNFIFYSWTDTDPSNSNGGNDAPDLFGRALDVDNQTMTSVINWTGDDNNWASQVLMPKVSPISLNDGNCTHTVPTVIMDLEDGNELTSVSFWYFTDIAYDACNDFTESAIYISDCGANPVATNLTTIDPDCGMTNGSIEVAVTSGVAPYVYEWSNNAGGNADSLYDNAAAGLYEIVVSDSRGCSEMISVSLQSQNAGTVNILKTEDITCNGLSNGLASVAVSGGTAPYTYLWSNGETDSLATALPAGASTVEVTDASGCVSFASVQVSEPAAISINGSGSEVACPSDMDGTASVLATGGTGMLSYAWSTGDTTMSISNLGKGSYTIDVTDENGCVATSSVEVSGPEDFQSTIQSNPNIGETEDTFSGMLIASVSGGTAPYSFHWTGANGIDTTAVGLNILQGLCGGEYQVEVTDANGCSFTDTVTVEVALTGVNCADIVSVDPLTAAGIATVNVFPNPTNGAFSIEVELNNADEVNIEVFDVRGQQVAAQALGFSAVHNAKVSLNNPAAGIYLVRISTTQGVVSRKLIVR